MRARLTNGPVPTSLAAALLLVSACRTTNPTPSDVRLVGGTYAAPGQFPGLASYITDDASGNPMHSCGVTKIGALHFLTAGHCVSTTTYTHAELDFADGSTIRIDVGPVVNTAAPAYRLTVNHVYLNPSWARNNLWSEFHNGYYTDLAIIEVREPTPALTPIPVRFQPIAIGASVVLAGFGHETFEETGGGALKFGFGLVNKLHNGAFELSPVDSNQQAIGFGRGDSGSGVFDSPIPEQQSLIGVVSSSVRSTRAGVVARLDNATPGEASTWMRSIVPDLMVADPM